MKKLLSLILIVTSSAATAQVPVPNDSWYRQPNQHLPLYNNRFGPNYVHRDENTAGAIVLGIGIAAMAINQAEQARRIRELEAENQRRAIEAQRQSMEQSPYSTTERVYVRKCTGWREVTDEYGRTYRERVCL